MTYFEKLKDPRWQKKRLEIMERADFSCESCPNLANATLHIHHGYYEIDLDPWEYENETLWCLCEGCHTEAKTETNRMRKELAKINFCYYQSVIDAAKEKVSFIKKQFGEEYDRMIANNG